MNSYYQLKRWIVPRAPKKIRKGKPLKPFECISWSVVGSAILTAFIWYMTTIPW